MKQILFVGVGSAIGGILRFVVSKGFAQLAITNFPIATLTINFVGSFFIGLFYAMNVKQTWINANVLLFLTTGICGGFTTFSTFSYENLQLLRSGQPLYAFIYILGSISLGLLGVFLGSKF
jgi:CrcB protein